MENEGTGFGDIDQFHAMPFISVKTETTALRSESLPSGGSALQQN